MSKLKQLFDKKTKRILNVYFTAGYPKLEDTENIILALEKNGVDLIEVGMPYSDPLADGPTIQDSGQIAIANGMTLPVLFEQLKKVRQKTQIPLVFMGYFNQVMQYGEELFAQKCKEVGIDALILPDMPLHVYEEEYQAMFKKYDLDVIFLITLQTEPERIRKVDELSNGFIYMVSSASITGAKADISEAQITYFKRIEAMHLKNPCLIGFGISDNKTFTTACEYANGAIIGSAFIKAIGKSKNVETTIDNFVKDILK